MRDKPDIFQQSDEIWKAFNELADEEGIGEQAEDWEAWYKFFEIGYITGYENSAYERILGKYSVKDYPLTSYALKEETDGNE